ncbi:hypothetical protein [Clostridium nigeriense]|uniref:hypothetical protein n=1 Tax=Clostridium nigeriense TaxID=1805470 RepID=UPI0008329359|nr:hypothetical protein [Clostridium nigeriense]
MISKINVYNDKYYYKKIEYNENTVDVLINKLGKKRKVILYCENIFIKKYIYLGNKVEKYIEEKINEDFTNKNNLLFHYELDKENKVIYLYSLRNDKFRILYEDAIELSIEPIQFKVKNLIVKKYRGNKDFLIIYKVKNLYNVLTIENCLITDLIMNKSFSELEGYINDKRRKDTILVVDKYIKESKEIKDIEIDYFINLGVGTDEDIC